MVTKTTKPGAKTRKGGRDAKIGNGGMVATALFN